MSVFDDRDDRNRDQDGDDASRVTDRRPPAAPNAPYRELVCSHQEFPDATLVIRDPRPGHLREWIHSTAYHPLRACR